MAPNKEWHSVADKFYAKGWKPVEIRNYLSAHGVNVTRFAISSHLYRQKKKAAEKRELHSGRYTWGTGEDEAEVPTKPVVIQNQIPETHENAWDGTKTLKFAIMGDTQFGSKYTQISYLNRFYKLCSAEGIDTIYHTGDITDGLYMRPGHEQELYLTSADDMVRDVVQNYPMVAGITTKFITGNHDASIFKRVGYDIGVSIAAQRPDMEYLGRDCAIVNLTPNCTLELRHPWDGTAYALSYKPQKMIEAMEADSKPNILAIGHYHKAEYLFYRNVHCLQTGCFQSQTPFTRGKGISVHMGGWLVTIRVDEEGHIQSFAPEFIPFYKPIADDYKAYYKL